MTGILAILTSIMQAVLPALLPLLGRPDQGRLLEADADDDVRQTRLLGRVRSFTGIPFALALIALTGCTRHEAVFVQPGVPVLLAEDIDGVAVMVRSSRSGELVKAVSDLKAGWWIVYDEEQWPTEERVGRMNLEVRP